MIKIELTKENNLGIEELKMSVWESAHYIDAKKIKFTKIIDGKLYYASMYIAPGFKEERITEIFEWYRREV